jgi:poly(beta-D-mannuronate) lyase
MKEEGPATLARVARGSKTSFWRPLVMWIRSTVKFSSAIGLAFTLALASGCSGAAAPGGESASSGGHGAGASGGQGGSDRGGSGGGGGTSCPGGSGGDRSGGSGGAPEGGSGGEANGSGGMSGTDANTMGEGGNAGSAGSGNDAGPPPPSQPDPALPACKREVMIANAAALDPALLAVKPGDCLLLADGDYPAPTITAKGSADAPIVLRAANRLKANFNGVVKITDATYVILEGFSYPGASGTAIAGASTNCRVTRSRFFTGTANVAGTAKDNRIDHSEFGPKSTDGNLVQPTAMSENTRIDHNYFHDVTGGGGNGRETIRLGCCGAPFDNHEAGNLVEHNLLVNCSGEAEIISVKASKNVIRYNTIRSSTGNITLRAGKNDSVYGNFVFGTGNQGGLRIFDSGHRIYNNYIETGSALIGNRVDEIHAAVTGAVIVNNTFLGKVTLAGSGNTFSNNITLGGDSLGGATAMANLTKDAAGLVKMGEVQAITGMSKAVDASVGSFAFVIDDVNGQPRSKPDIGADEFSTGPALYGPLMPADVGPNAP